MRKLLLLSLFSGGAFAGPHLWGATISIPVDNFDGTVSWAPFSRAESYTTPGYLYELGPRDSVGLWEVPPTPPGAAEATVEVLTPSYWQSPDGHNTLDMDGLTIGQIRTILIVPESGTVTVNFWLAANPNPDNPPPQKTLQVALGAASQVFNSDGTGHSFGSMGWTEESAVFANVAAGPTMLTLTSLDGPLGSEVSAGGPAVGTFTAFETTTVPEGGTTSMLLGIGMVGLNWVRRFVKK